MDPIEDLVRRVVTDDVDEDSPEYRGICADSPEVAARASSLRALQRRLDRAGLVVQSGDVGGECSPAELEFEQRVRAVAGASVSRRARWMPAAAAIVIAGIGLMLARERGGAEPVDRERMRLGGEALPVPNQDSRQAGFQLFDWAALGFDDTHTYRLSIYADAARLKQLHPPVETDGRSWSPGAAAEASWPDRIYYSLEVVGASGAVRQTFDVTADRTR